MRAMASLRSVVENSHYPGAAKQQPKSGFAAFPRTCRDGPAGRLYDAPTSSEILAGLRWIFRSMASKTRQACVSPRISLFFVHASGPGGPFLPRRRGEGEKFP